MQIRIIFIGYQHIMYGIVSGDSEVNYNRLLEINIILSKTKTIIALKSRLQILITIDINSLKFRDRIQR